MKKFNLQYVALIPLFCVVFVSGCAKEPVEKPMGTETVAEVIEKEQTTQDVVEEVTQETAVPDVELARVHFPFDKFTLTDEARVVLASNAMVMKSAPELNVSIEGHCDTRGSDEYNLSLGERRAQVVKNYLVSLGVSAERLETISYGEEMPVDKTSTETAWALNRRAEFKALN